MWLVEENTNHGVLFFGNTRQGGDTQRGIYFFCGHEPRRREEALAKVVIKSRWSLYGILSI